MNGKLLLVLLFIFPSIGFSQYEKVWELHKPTNRQYPYSHNINSRNYLKTVTNDQKLFITLSARKNSDSNLHEIFIFCYDDQGKTHWEYVYPSFFGSNVFPNDIAIDNKNNIIIGARVAKPRNSDFQALCGVGSINQANYLIFKVDKKGKLIWERTLSTKSESNDFCTSLVVDENREIYTIGSLSGKCMLHNFDENGTELWTKELNHLIPHQIELYSDELICITKSETGKTNSIVYFITKQGEILDRFLLDHLFNYKPKFDLNKNLNNFQSDGAYFVQSFSKNGDLNWIYSKPSNPPKNRVSSSEADITFDESGNTYLTGYYPGKHYGDSLLHTGNDILTTKLNIDGKIVWEALYDNNKKPLTGESGKAIKLDSDHNVWVCGNQTVEMNGHIYGSSDILILKYNQNGEQLDRIVFNSKYNRKDRGINLKFYDNDLYIYGYSENLNGSYDSTIVKYSKK